MTDFIKWCNDNNGFLTAILSIIGLFLSIIAMVVSIRTARLPYKKKLLLGSSLLLAAEVTIGGDVRTFIAGLSASATNVGNRPVNLTYLGYAIKKDGKFKKIYPLNRRFDSKAMLAASEMLEVHFQTDELKKRIEIQGCTYLYTTQKELSINEKPAQWEN